MQISTRPIALSNQVISELITELGEECQNVIALIHQLQLPHLSAAQQAEILAELLAAAIHLHIHCDQDFQQLVAEEMERLPDETEVN